MTRSPMLKDRDNDDPVSITLLTGFLGAGKTTLVNQLLTANHGRRVAVIVNEFGELGIDAALIENASGSVIELANGCICCATKGELTQSIQEMLTTNAGVESLLIETSGLVDPAPVIAELESVRFIRETRLDGVVTVIDAENFDRNLDSAEAAFRQIVCGDILMINKIDLVAPGIPDLIETGLRRLNPHARVIRAICCEAPLDLVLGPARTSGLDPAYRRIDGDHIHDGFLSASLSLAAPLDPDRFGRWLESLPVTIFRVKGFVRFAGNTAPCVVHCVGERRLIGTAPNHVVVSGASLVLIGHDVQNAKLIQGLEACAAA